MKPIITFITLLLALTINTHAQEHVTNRQILSLDKGWRFHLGDIPFPIIKGHGASYRNAKAGHASGAASPTYDDSSWRILNLPHDWAIESRVDSTANLSQGYYHRGIGWYRRQFRLSPEDKGKHLELQLDGIATHATIWVNGTILHRNWCGYTSMYIDITPYATYGDNINTICVRVDADAQEGWWYEGAGIYRHTWLIKRSPLHIVTDGIYSNPIKSSEDNRWEIPVEVTIENSGRMTANAEVEVSLWSPNNQQIATQTTRTSIQTLRQTKVQLSLSTTAPMLWSPEKPTLYKVRTIIRQNGVKTDEVETRCGFRTFRFDPQTGFWLNGKNIKIKGTCNHQDHAGVGVAVPDALWEFRLRKLKEMGVNAYRPAHNPMSKEFMAACDSIGILVMDENRLFNTSPEYIRQLEWLVRRDRNCPSVILWSVFNEEPMQGTENGYEMVRRMYEVVKELDATRPVTAAMNGGFFAHHNVSQAVDVGGFNYQIKSYDRFHQENPQLPLTSSEDGSAFMVRGEYVTDSARHIFDSYDTASAKWGATHRQAWKAIAERPWMAGCFYWTGFDYHGEPTPFQWPSVSSFFGAMDLCGFPKMAYHLHRAQWIEHEPVLELIPHWNWLADSIGKPIKVMALSNADSVRIILNGKILSTQAVDIYEMNTWFVPYRPGKLEAIGFKRGEAVSHTQIETTGKPVRLRLTPYRSQLAGNGQDAMPITIEAIDAKGRHVPTANHPIELSLTGPATIIGLGNGNPNSHEPEKGNKRELFNGLAQVIIQGKEGFGEAVLQATTPGLETATITIPIQQVPLIPSVPVENPPLVLSKWQVSSPFINKPDINIVIDDNDMNSWQPATTGNVTTLESAHYVIWRTTFTPRKKHQTNGGSILLKKVMGKAEIWLNGHLLGVKEKAKTEDIQVQFPPITGNKCELKILFTGQPQSSVGLKGNVTIHLPEL